MAYERFANGGLSSLAAGIDDSVLALTVKSAVGFPTGGNFNLSAYNTLNGAGVAVHSGSFDIERGFAENRTNLAGVQKRVVRPEQSRDGGGVG